MHLDLFYVVYRVFENVASSYDKMNDVMSFGIHRLWKDRLVRVLNPPAGTKLLDVAGGTGIFTFSRTRVKFIYAESLVTSIFSNFFFYFNRRYCFQVSKPRKK